MTDWFKGRINEEGLSWSEWVYAAGQSDCDDMDRFDELAMAWAKGEDPCEYRGGV